MKKNLLIAAIAITALASCSSNDFVGDESPQTSSGNVGAISFTSGTPAVTRALGSDAAGLLNNNFVVFGYKTDNSGTQTVFNNYQVNYVDENGSSAGSTESNSAGWEYVGYKNLPYGTGTKENEVITLNNNGVATNATATGIDQSIKYWDFSASSYDFFAYSLGAGDTHNSNWAKASAMSNSTYTLEGTGAQLATCYISNKKSVKPATNATEVDLEFRSFSSQIELKFYETIPGYSVKALQFYADGEENSNPGTTPYLFAVGQNALPAGGKYTVTFDNDGKALLTFDTNTNPSYASSIAFSPTLTGYATASDYREAYAANTYIERTSNAATSTAPLPVLPNPGNNQVLNLRIDYTLVSRDGSGEEIKVTGATAVIPAAYAKWQPNYKYTYIFKISDNTNGQTGGDITGLYPITLDAVVTDAQDGSQTTITTVAATSITTYQNGAIANEYTASTPIYVVAGDGTATLTDENAKLYTATVEAGAAQGLDGSGNVAITEEQVANVLTKTLDNGKYTVTDANGKKMTVTPSEALSILSENEVVGGITYATGKAAKFTPADNTVYVFEFIDTSDGNKKYYKVIKVGTPTPIQPEPEP